MINKKTLEILEMIQQDMANDVTEFGGKPFNGKTVATYFGNQGAAIAALARIIAQTISSGDRDGNTKSRTTPIRPRSNGGNKRL